MYNQSMQDFQRGLSEAQNGYGFGMIPGHGLRREPYFSQPDVRTRSATAPNYMIFGVLVLL